MTKILVTSENNRMKEGIRSILLEEKTDKEFDTNYLQKISNTRLDVEKRLLKLMAFNFLLLISVFLYVSAGANDFTFFGYLITNTPEVREFLFLFIVAIGVFESVVARNIDELKIIEDTILEYIFDNVAERTLMKASLPTLWGGWGKLNEVISDDKVEYTLMGVVFIFLPIILHGILVMIILLMYGWIFLSVWLEIWRFPNFPEPWNLMILIFSAFAILNSIIVQFARNLPLPYLESHKKN